LKAAGKDELVPVHMVPTSAAEVKSGAHDTITKVLL